MSFPIKVVLVLLSFYQILHTFPVGRAAMIARPLLLPYATALASVHRIIDTAILTPSAL